MSERTDLDFIEDILESARRAMGYCAGMTYNVFLEDMWTQDAVVRNIAIPGKA